jgi:tetratricopeptide (TPR) repeat protein
MPGKLLLRTIMMLPLLIACLSVNTFGQYDDDDDDEIAARRLTAEGMRLLKQGRYAAAHERFDHALDHCEGHGEAFYGRGLCLQKMGNHVDALGDFEEAIDTTDAENHNTLLVLVAMATSYQRLGDYQNAVRAMQVYIDLSPYDGNGYINSAWLLSFTGDRRGALEAGKKAVKYAPNIHMSFTNLCRALNDLGRYQEAADTCRQALQLKPGDGESLLYLGYAYSHLNQLEAAKSSIKNAITGLSQFVNEHKDEPDGYYLLGNAYLANNQPQQAINWLNAAIRLQPQFPFAVANLGSAYLLAGNRLMAISQYNLLRRMNSTEAEKLWKKIESSRIH